MGVDLKLLPLLSKSYWTAHDMLGLERRRELWPEIDKIPQRDIPGPVNCFLARGADGDPCYGSVEESPYGERLKFTTAGDLLALKDHDAVQDNFLNRAVWKYLAEMPPDWPIILYWH